MEPLIEVGHQLELSETRREAAIPQVINVHPAPENSVSNPDKLKKPEKSVSESLQSSEHFPLSENSSDASRLNN